MLYSRKQILTILIFTSTVAVAQSTKKTIYTSDSLIVTIDEAKPFNQPFNVPYTEKRYYYFQIQFYNSFNDSTILYLNKKLLYNGILNPEDSVNNTFMRYGILETKMLMNKKNSIKLSFPNIPLSVQSRIENKFNYLYIWKINEQLSFLYTNERILSY
jgi:hypothetical protein